MIQNQLRISTNPLILSCFNSVSDCPFLVAFLVSVTFCLLLFNYCVLNFSC